MIIRRVGLVLATLLALLAALPALIIEPDPETGEVGPLAILVAVISVGIALATVALVVPAWRGRRAPAFVIAALQLVSVIPSLPAFLLPANQVPTGGVIAASLAALLGIVAFTLIAVEGSTLLRYIAALVAVLALYASVVSIVSGIVPESAGRGIQAVTAIGAALLFQPVVMLMRRVVGRVFYGHRADPTGAALRVGRSMTGRDDVVSAAVDETARALRLPRLRVQRNGVVVAEGGDDPGTEAPTHAVEVGAVTFLVTLRPGERRLHPSDRSALELISLPFDLLIRESMLADELRLARVAVVEAREVERSQLHRDLHDGVGPIITGAALRVDAARNLLDAASTPALDHLDVVRAELRAAVAEIRRVVYGLRPLELEQLGLWGALGSRARAIGAEWMMPDDQLAVSAAAELALYRIAAEALTNAERHARGTATRLEVTEEGDGVRLVVNSAGVPSAEAVDGVGIRSMRARAEELGGRTHIGPSADGWTVDVWLPRGAMLEG